MNYVQVRNDECKGCGVCVPVCPYQCLTLGTQLNSIGYRPVVFANTQRCTACGLCFRVCPEFGALTVVSVKEA